MMLIVGFKLEHRPLTPLGALRRVTPLRPRAIDSPWWAVVGVPSARTLGLPWWRIFFVGAKEVLRQPELALCFLRSRVFSTLFLKRDMLVLPPFVTVVVISRPRRLLLCAGGLLARAPAVVAAELRSRMDPEPLAAGGARGGPSAVRRARAVWEANNEAGSGCWDWRRRRLDVRRRRQRRATGDGDDDGGCGRCRLPSVHVLYVHLRVWLEVCHPSSQAPPRRLGS